jgi:hypothetical protein
MALIILSIVTKTFMVNKELLYCMKMTLMKKKIIFVIFNNLYNKILINSI